jgi:hypothetical protein
MVGIRINTSDLREGDAPGPLYRRFDQLPASFLVLGNSPTWVNWLLSGLSLVVLFAFGSIKTFFVGAGFTGDAAGALTFMCLVLCFVSRPAVSFVIRQIRSRRIHISPDQIIIERPNNLFADDITTPLKEYRGLCRRWGSRHEGRSEIKQEILELLHMDSARTITIRVTEDHTSKRAEIALLAEQLGVDYIEDTFKKRNAAAHAQPNKSSPQKIAAVPRQLTPPPSGVRVENRVGTSKFGTRLAVDFPWNLFWSRVIVSTISGSAVFAGWFWSSNILIAMSGMVFIPVAWRTMVGRPGVMSILIEGKAIHLEPDGDCLIGRLVRDETTKTVSTADILDVYTRQRQDGKSHELILQTATREIPVEIALGKEGLNWARDFLKQKIQ